jgi:hypothetical protein
MLLPACDGPLDGIDEPCVHAHKPIARPFTDDFVAGLARCGGEDAAPVARLFVALVVRHAGKLAAEIPPSVRPPTAAWRAGEVRKELDRLDRGTVREHRDKRT